MVSNFSTLASNYNDRYQSEDAAMVQAAQTQPSAFDAIYKRYMTSVYSYVRARTSNDEDAADLTQQVFLQALAALPKYQERGLPLAAWLLRIARNTTTDFLRHRKLSVWNMPPDASQVTSEEDPEATVLRIEAATRVRSLLAELDADKREVLLLRFGSGLKVREIAYVLDRSESAIKTELRRTLRALKEHYIED